MKSIGEEFDERSRAIPYPVIGPAPRREDFESAKVYGVALGEWEAERDEATRGRQAYSQAQSALNNEFKFALAKECGIPKDHPKLDRWFSIAWSEGHSSGYSEVANYGITLAELLVD